MRVRALTTERAHLSACVAPIDVEPRQKPASFLSSSSERFGAGYLSEDNASTSWNEGDRDVRY